MIVSVSFISPIMQQADPVSSRMVVQLLRLVPWRRTNITKPQLSLSLVQNISCLRSFGNSSTADRSSNNNDQRINPGHRVLLSSRGDLEQLRPPTTIQDVSSIMFDPKVHLGSIPTSWKGYENETPVGKELLEYILGVTGRPISTAQFMNTANLHPQYGYYVNAQTQRCNNNNDSEDEDEEDETTTTNILVGDFVTAPEISSAFTDCLAIWFYTFVTTHHTASTQQQQEPQQQEAPIDERYQYIECGPGTGRLMADWISCTMQLKKPLPTSIHLIEASPKLRQTQKETLIALMKERPQLKLDFVHVPSSSINDNNNRNSGVGSNLGSTTTTTLLSSGCGEDDTTLRVYWHDTFTDCIRHKKDDKTPVFLVAQEFLDALPIYSFEADQMGRLRERLVDVVVHEELEEEFTKYKEDGSSTGTTNTTTSMPNNTNPGSGRMIETSTSAKRGGSEMLKPRFRVVLAPEVTPPLKLLLPVDEDGNLLSSDDDDTGEKVPVPPGTVVEVSPEAILFCQDVAALLAKVGGAALVIDYGDTVTGDTIRAYWNHRQVPFLSRPGHVDVTADVNFGSLQHAVARMGLPVSAHGPVEQGQFLMSMGIQERIVNMMERDETTYEQADDMYRALVRLVSSEEMGKRYKVMAIVPGHRPPPGFENGESNTAVNATTDLPEEEL